MNRILIVLAFVATSGCATASPELDALLRENAQLRRANASQGRELEYERRASSDLAFGRATPGAQQQTAQVEVRGELGMAQPTPAPMRAPVGGYRRVASPAHVAAPQPWYGQSDAALEVPVRVHSRSYAVGIIVNGVVVPILHGDAEFPTTIQVETPAGLSPGPAVPRGTDATVRFLVPRVGPNLVEFTCYVVAAGTAQPWARWSVPLEVPTTRTLTVFDHTCQAHRIR